MDLELLKAERKKRGITQEKLAKCLGFRDKSSYCLIENGKTSVSVDTANQIAINLGLSKEMTYKIFFEPKVQATSTNDILTNGGDIENGKHSSKDNHECIL